LVKSEVDEKNVDEEISKIKDKLANKIAEREKSRKDEKGRSNDDDDFFSSAGIPGEGRSRGANDGEMNVDERPSTTRKRAVQELSDDDLMEMPTTKKPRSAPAKAPAKKAPAKPPPASRPRRSSDSSSPQPARRVPARTAASRSKKAPPLGTHY